MPNRNDCWGIEVGANAIKAIRLVRKKAEIVVADYEVLPFKKILTTPDINVDEAIQVNLDQFLNQHFISKSTVVISVPGHMAFARPVKLPPVDPKKIPDIVRFEAVQQIPFPIDQVEWDYQVFARADSPDVEAVIVAMTKEKITQYLSNYFAVGMSVDGMTTCPMAVYNALAYDMELTPESPGVIMVDIGTTATDLIVVDNGSVWLRNLPIGGNNFTEALVRAFKLSFSKAERLKREAGTSKYARQIFQAMRPVFADLVQEMQRSLGYYQSLYRDAKLTKLIGVGSTFRLPGMQKFLKQQLQMEVIRPDGFKRVKIAGKEESAFAESAMNLATAYGLALQGLELEKISINLLPTKLVRQRIWHDKSVWFGAAAGLMVLAVGIAGGRLWLDESSYQRAYDARKDAISETEDTANRYIDSMRAASGKVDPRDQIDNVRGVLDYRDVWPKLMEDLDLAAKALAPQKELDDSDYVAISRIPRAERRRIYITSYTAEYHFDPMPEPRPTAVAVQSGPGAARAAVAFTKAGNSLRATLDRKPWGGASPYYIITLKGTTPYKDGNELIGTAFVKWLQDNAVRADRPYRIVVDPTKIICEQNVDTSSYGTGAIPMPTPEAPASEAPPPATPPSAASSPPAETDASGAGTPTKHQHFSAMAGGMVDDDDTSTPAPGATSAAPAAPIAPPPSALPPAQVLGPDSIYPQRPLQDESKDNDWTFVITWEVQLVRPEDVRRTQDDSNANMPPPPTVLPAKGQPSPASPTAQVLPLAPNSSTPKPGGRP